MRLDDAFTALMMLSALACTAGPLEVLRARIETQSIEHYRQMRTAGFVAESFGAVAQSGKAAPERWLQDIRGEYGLESASLEKEGNVSVLRWKVSGTQYRLTIPGGSSGGTP